MAQQVAKGTYLESVSSGAGSALWNLTTTHTVKQVLAPGWFDRFAEYGLRRPDRILAVVDTQGEPQCLEFIILANELRKVTVRQIGGPA